MSLLKFTSVLLVISFLFGCASTTTIRTSVSANVKSEVIEVPSRAATDFKAAIEFMNQNKMDLAKAAFEKMTLDYPQLAGPYANLGVIYSADKDWENAQENLEKAHAKNKHNVKVLNQLGYVYRQQGEFKKAKVSYEKAIKVHPEYAATYLNLGVLYDIYMGNLQKASQQYQKYQSLQKTADRRVAGWIVDINRRAGIKTQVAGGQ